MPSAFRIVVWNANMALHRKLGALAALKPDVAIVPESADPATLESSPLARSTAWVGSRPAKGLAVLGYNDTGVALRAEYDERLEWVAPIDVSGPLPFALLAVWAFHHRAGQFHPLEPRTAQPQQALDVYRHLFTEGPVVIAGDFNDNVRWDRGERATNWTFTVRRYKEIGLVSAYHEYFGEVQGDESTPTLYWQSRRADGPRYHIDYCFIPEGWLPALRSVSVGSHADWVAPGLSDHVPLVVDLDLEQLARRGPTNRG